MNRVLVTGASGCLGRHIVPLLCDRAWDVHAVSSHQQPLTNAVTWHQADLLNTDDVRHLVERIQPTHLMHLAWYVAPGSWAQAQQNFVWAEAGIELMRQFRRYGGRRMVTAGSCLEYDWRYGLCSESLTPCRPHTAYGACKQALQILQTSYASTAGISAAWGRLFSIYGPHEHPRRLIPSVITSVLDGLPARCSHGTQLRDYLFAQDAAEAFVALLDSDIQGPINIATGRCIPIKDISLTIGRLLGRPDLIHLGAIPEASTDFPLVAADIQRQTSELKWAPKWDLESGLRHSIDWWRSQTAGTLAESKAS